MQEEEIKAYGEMLITKLESLVGELNVERLDPKELLEIINHIESVRQKVIAYFVKTSGRDALMFLKRLDNCLYVIAKAYDEKR